MNMYELLLCKTKLSEGDVEIRVAAAKNSNNSKSSKIIFCTSVLLTYLFRMNLISNSCSNSDFMKQYDVYFHIGFAIKIDSGASHITAITFCASPLRGLLEILCHKGIRNLF